MVENISSNGANGSTDSYSQEIEVFKQNELSPVDHKTTLLLNWFGGFVGLHHFYAGKPLKGLISLVTFSGGLLGSLYSIKKQKPKGVLLFLVAIFGSYLWSLLNEYQIVMGTFTDGKERPIRQANQIKKDKISSTDYKTTVLLRQLFSPAAYFYSGRTMMGAFLVVVGAFALATNFLFTVVWAYFNISVLLELSGGKFKDSEGKIICPPHMIQDEEKQQG